MSSSVWGYLFIMLGIIAIALLLLFSGISTKDEQNYYSLKETTEAAMMDSVDQNAYEVGLTQAEVDNEKNKDSIHCVSGQPGTVRIVKEQFVESFIRRFADTTNIKAKYKIIFYDIDECPPKVSLRIISEEKYDWVNRLFKYDSDKDTAEIVNDLSAILESKKVD